MKLLVVLNPSSHDFEARERWPMLEGHLEGAASVTLLETEPDEKKTHERIREALSRGSFDRVVSIGGDGTLHTVANAIVGARLASLPDLAVIAFGTANNVARSLRLPLDDLPRMARIAAGSVLEGFDLARVRTSGARGTDERIWVNCVGTGIDAAVVSARKNYRELGGYLGYAAALAERSVAHRSIDVRLTVDSQSFSTRLYNVVVSNVPIYAGTLELPGSRRDDGLLDVYLMDRLEYGSKLLSFAIKKADFLNWGVSEFLEEITENQRTLHGRTVKLELETPCLVQVDGEALEESTTIECDIVGRVRVAVGS
ncbi:hypothetical protein HY251_13320 [bacterium]|nr:hypothetical protein [bacterium]